MIACDPYVDDEVFSSLGVERVSIDQVLEESDYISCHVPLTEKTHHMFNYQAFRRMKPGSYFINTSRGPVVDEAGLHRALVEKQLAGAALDVMENEPPPKDHPLFELDNVIITPSYGLVLRWSGRGPATHDGRGSHAGVERSGAVLMS